MLITSRLKLEHALEEGRAGHYLDAIGTGELSRSSDLSARQAAT